MMNIKLSIIIPCYNVENFIRPCLERISQIPLNPNEFEILCYNDCSTDNTIEILKSESQRYTNIKILQGSINIGPGGGRNYALKNATGEYIWFVDADDLIIPNVISSVASLIAKDKIDVIPFNYKEIDIDNNITAEPIVYKDSAVMNGLDFVESVFNTEIVYHMGYPWRFIVRKDFLIQNHIQFPESIRYGEDTVWMPQVLLLADKVASISDCGYLYRHHTQSTCGMFDNSYPGRIMYERCIVASSLLLSFAKDITTTINDDKIKKYTNAFRLTVKRRYIGQLPIYLGRASLKERKVFYEYLRNKGCDSEIKVYAPLLTRLMLCPIGGRIIAESIVLFYKLKH